MNEPPRRAPIAISRPVKAAIRTHVRSCVVNLAWVMLMMWGLLSTERLTQRTAEGFSRLKGRRTRAMTCRFDECARSGIVPLGRRQDTNGRLGERVADPLEPALTDGDHLEGRLQPGVFGMRREPGLGRPAQASLLLGADHLEGIAAPGAVLRLHLAEDEPAPTPDDQVELVDARPDIGAQDPVAEQPVMQQRLLLRRVIHTAEEKTWTDRL